VRVAAELLTVILGLCVCVDVCQRCCVSVQSTRSMKHYSLSAHNSLTEANHQRLSMCMARFKHRVTNISMAAAVRRACECSLTPHLQGCCRLLCPPHQHLHLVHQSQQALNLCVHV
jgi:hypothetical protein